MQTNFQPEYEMSIYMIKRDQYTETNMSDHSRDVRYSRSIWEYWSLSTLHEDQG